MHFPTGDIESIVRQAVIDLWNSLEMPYESDVEEYTQRIRIALEIAND